MWGGRGTWRVRGALFDLEVEVAPAAAGADRSESVRELLPLVQAFLRREPEARRAVVAIHARLQGLEWLARDALAIGASPGRDRVIADELLSAARAGRLVARRLAPRAIAVPADAPSAEDALGPPSSQQAPVSKTWVGLVLVDQDGAPVPNRPYRVIQPDGTQVDGTLDSNGTAFVRSIDPGNCQIWCPYVEPHPQTTYTVQQGDHVSGVAESFGFDDFSDVWSDPGNADLQGQRPDPHVLAPGDALTIPEVKAQPAANKPTGAKHTFQVKRSPLKLRVKLLDLAAKPMASAPVTVNGAQLTADGTGLVETNVDKSARDLSLQAPDAAFDLDVGAINPPDDTTDAGYRARLFNLGFLWDPAAGDTSDEMIIALQDFQAQYGLTISGELDDATRSQLTQAFGC